MKEKTAVLFSGGKDSCLALHKAIKMGDDVRVLISVMPEIKDSLMFHTPDARLLEKQTEMLGLPLMTKKTKARSEDEELNDLIKIISDAKEKYKIKKLVIGGIASNYQGQRIKKICDKVGLEVSVPLWNYTAEKLWQELLGEGFKVVLIKISCEGLPKEFLGRVIDKKMLVELKKLSEKYKFRLDFEGGEAETAILFMPEFKNEIKIEFSVESEGEYRHFLKNIRVFDGDQNSFK
jgi:ABC transporter with metal-binding/Fe-S-binding domain ATP-binding protein